jgi:two-component system OmpR family response regulator
MSQTRVLVVDDEDDIARAIAMRLRYAGYHVMTAGNGTEAVHLALYDAPDLVILDIGLPGQDGHEIAQRLFTMSATISTPIIFLTARRADEDRTRAYQVGAVAYLTKPFRSYDLLTAVSRAESASRQMRCAECMQH